MSHARAFAAFLYDFAVGEDPVVFVLVCAGLGATAIVAAAGGSAWWLLPVVVVTSLLLSIVRASRAAAAAETAGHEREP